MTIGTITTAVEKFACTSSSTPRGLTHAILAAVVLLACANTVAVAQCLSWLPPVIPDTAIGANNRVLAAVAYTSPQGGGAPWTIVAGEFAQIGGRDIQYLAAWDGVTWRDIGATRAVSAINGRVTALAIYNGRLIAAGFFSQAGTTPVNNIAQWNGFAWEEMGTGITQASNPPSARVNDLQVFGSELVAAGHFSAAGGLLVNNIAKWNGAAWSEFSSGLQDDTACNCPEVYALEVYNGQLIAGGHFERAGSISTHNIARWSVAGWSPLSLGFGIGSDSAVLALCLQGGYLYVGGISNTDSSRIMRWNGTVWDLLNNHVGSAGVNGTVRALVPYFGGVLIGGDFTEWGGFGSPYLVRWLVTDQWSDFSLTNGPVHCLAVAGGPIIMGGQFTHLSGSICNHVAYINGSFAYPFHETPQSIYALTTFNGKVYSGGTFIQPGNGTVESPDVRNIARWDGLAVKAMSTGINGTVTALKGYNTGNIPFQNRNVAAGGTFTNAGGVTVSNIAVWIEPSDLFDPPDWHAMGAGLNGAVNAIERFNNNTYAAGAFMQSGATPVSRIARFDGTNWVAVGTGLNGTAHALKVYNGQLYVGGSFDMAGGFASGGLARWNGTTWSIVGGNFSGTVYALEVYNGELVIGGLYAGIGGSPNIARYNGTTYSTLGTGGTSGAVRSLAVHDGKIHISGDFSAVGGGVANSSHLACWSSANGWQGLGNQYPTHALASIQTELHVGGVYDGTVRLPAWKRVSTTGYSWFISQPAFDWACMDADVSCSVQIAEGYDSTLTWKRNGLPVLLGPTGTGSTIASADTELTIVNVSAADSGNYTCTIADPGLCGSVVSSVAMLAVFDAGSGDGNGDGKTNGSDIKGFVNFVQFGGPMETEGCAYDMNADSLVNLVDLPLFVAVLTN